MNHEILIPGDVMTALRAHLFQSDLEQAAFLFAAAEERECGVQFQVTDLYLVPPSAWEIQCSVYLEMRDDERGKILQTARARGSAIIDCHSHPGSGGDVWFSPSDLAGITEFSRYARWKLDGKPFAALVWGEDSVDGVAWMGNFECAEALSQIVVQGTTPLALHPRGSWFTPRRAMNRFSYEVE